MQLHELKPTKKTDRAAKRIGRGGKRGKTSGRGHKGQLARAGNSSVPQMRETIKKLPKLRGHGINRARTVNSDKAKPVVVNVAALESAFTAGDAVSPSSLVAAGAVAKKQKQAPTVKILGNGELTKKLTVTGCTVSESAKEKITKAGGSVA